MADPKKLADMAAMAMASKGAAQAPEAAEQKEEQMEDILCPECHMKVQQLMALEAKDPGADNGQEPIDGGNQ